MQYGRPDFRLEREAIGRGFNPVVGCDEAGRGAIAGPIVAAAIILDLGAFRMASTTRSVYLLVDETNLLQPFGKQALSRSLFPTFVRWMPSMFSKLRFGQ
jgi:hypothetical protein